MQKIQLICFPYAGGSAAFFHGLKEELQDQIEVTAAEYAGHGTRRKESYYHTFDELVQDMTDMVRKVRNPEIPYAILGYSMGSVVAYEVWKAYRKQGSEAIGKQAVSESVYPAGESGLWTAPAISGSRGA